MSKTDRIGEAKCCQTFRSLLHRCLFRASSLDYDPRIVSSRQKYKCCLYSNTWRSANRTPALLLVDASQGVDEEVGSMLSLSSAPSSSRPALSRHLRVVGVSVYYSRASS